MIVVNTQQFYLAGAGDHSWNFWWSDSNFNKNLDRPFTFGLSVAAINVRLSVLSTVVYNDVENNDRRLHVAMVIRSTGSTFFSAYACALE